jgi:hypothetical protein
LYEAVLAKEVSVKLSPENTNIVVQEPTSIATQEPTSMGTSEEDNGSLYEEVPTETDLEEEEEEEEDDDDDDEKEETAHPSIVPIKVPIVVAVINVTVDMEASTPLETDVLDILRIDHHVILTKCEFVPIKLSTNKVETGKLFVSGYIRKNIEFTAVSSNETHFTIQNAPFHFSTTIEIPSQFPSIIYDPKTYNEKPYCELKSATINEIIYSREPVHADSNILGSSLVLNLSLELLQDRQISISKFSI